MAICKTVMRGANVCVCVGLRVLLGNKCAIRYLLGLMKVSVGWQAAEKRKWRKRRTEAGQWEDFIRWLGQERQRVIRVFGVGNLKAVNKKPNVFILCNSWEVCTKSSWFNISWTSKTCVLESFWALLCLCTRRHNCYPVSVFPAGTVYCQCVHLQRLFSESSWIKHIPNDLMEIIPAVINWMWNKGLWSPASSICTHQLPVSILLDIVAQHSPSAFIETVLWWDVRIVTL